MWSSWEESDCSKECGGGYKNFTRKIAKRAIRHGECPGASWRVEHCNEMLCSREQTQNTVLIAAVTIVSAVIVLGVAIFYRSKAKSTFEKVTISMQKLKSLGESWYCLIFAVWMPFFENDNLIQTFDIQKNEKARYTILRNLKFSSVVTNFVLSRSQQTHINCLMS